MKSSPTREKILHTALELFYTNGIRATGIDKIIHDSDVAKMSFYKHFPSKQTLVLAALERGEALWLEKFHAAVARAAGPREKILGAFEFLGTWFKAPDFRGCAFINATVESGSAETEERALGLRHKKELAKFFEQELRALGNDDKAARAAAKKLLLLFDGAIVRALMEQNAQSAGAARDLAELLLESL